MLKMDMRDADIIETELMEISAMTDDASNWSASSPGVRYIPMKSPSLCNISCGGATSMMPHPLRLHNSGDADGGAVRRP
jgi:hypothetical protein